MLIFLMNKFVFCLLHTPNNFRSIWGFEWNHIAYLHHVYMNGGNSLRNDSKKPSINNKLGVKLVFLLLFSEIFVQMFPFEIAEMCSVSLWRNANRYGLFYRPVDKMQYRLEAYQFVKVGGTPLLPKTKSRRIQVRCPVVEKTCLFRMDRGPDRGLRFPFRFPGGQLVSVCFSK